jgi:excisionase family DNA binding protein
MANALPALGALDPISVSIETAAMALEVSADTVRRMIRDGELPAYKLRAQWRIRVEDLHALGREPEPPQPAKATRKTKR